MNSQEGMTGARDVVIHQFRQMFLYTFYLGMFQCICFHYDLSPVWSVVAFITLLAVSVYEDSLIIEQTSIPESILVVRIWACNFPLIISNILLYALERGNLMRAEEAPGPKIPGRPQQILMVVMAKTGLSILDNIILLGGYYLYYFSAFAMFRSLVQQYRFVKRLAEENMIWSPNVEDTPVMPMSGSDGRNTNVINARL